MKPRHKKQAKDPNIKHVKKSFNPFMFYVRDHMKQVRASNPGVSQSELMKKVSHMWRNASQDEKDYYVQLFHDDQIRVQQEKNQVLASGLQLKKPAGNRGGVTGFMVFLKEQREMITGKEGLGVGMGQIATACGEVWKGMSQE